MTQRIIVKETETNIIKLITPGPQGPPGPAGGALPAGGNPGDIIIKSGYGDGDADWAPTLDGGTFF